MNAHAAHRLLCRELADYIRTQYFGKSPILRHAVEEQLNAQGVLYQEPYIESSPAYCTEVHGIAAAELPDWMKTYFAALSNAGLGVYPTPRSSIRCRRSKHPCVGKTFLLRQEPAPGKRSASCGRSWQNLLLRRVSLL